MTYTERIFLIASLVDGLRTQGSWCGETHIQKAIYLLQTVREVPLGFDFVLYRHGPFSFDLREQLTAMRADGFLVVEPQQYPYGPRLASRKTQTPVPKLAQQLVEKYQAHITAVAETVGTKGVVELEKLATAYFVNEENPGMSPDERASIIHQVKPHISYDEALEALGTAKTLRD